ncbi:XRE family transcriptional regulator [Nocardioides piscis]|uniref:XRE family transcriptional regulator n=1 Tax=Nocardioides piscis TaxID=2714938 RepID=A0A6G7YH66_9ACTN|nr:XRE family transcriptional regulator [Nocardioides piscis]QIK75978.1 XRE family transcriptional regulator [Nocardioides piscis]
MSVASGSFADELRRAIDRRGLGLERIRDHLDQRGVVVSVATLSYWQSGRSLPGRKASIAAIPHLEEVLALSPGQLGNMLPLTRDRPRRCAAQDLRALWPEPPVAEVLEQLDTRWDLELDRVTLHDVVRLGADRRQARLTVRQVMRARCDGPDRRVVIHFQDDRGVAPPDFRAVQGCEVRRTVRSAEHGVAGAELVFHHPLSRGETVVVEYEVISSSPGPLESQYTRRLRMPMREYLLQVEFHPDALPHEVAAVTEETRTVIGLDREHRAHLAHTDATPGTTGIRWDWHDDGPGAGS